MSIETDCLVGVSACQHGLSRVSNCIVFPIRDGQLKKSAKTPPIELHLLFQDFHRFSIRNGHLKLINHLRKTLGLSRLGCCHKHQSSRVICIAFQAIHLKLHSLQQASSSASILTSVATPGPFETWDFAKMPSLGGSNSNIGETCCQRASGGRL